MFEDIDKKQSRIARQLEETFSLYDLEVLHENYSCTIDFQREMQPVQIIQFNRMGFEVIHERETIYTLKR